MSTSHHTASRKPFLVKNQQTAVSAELLDQALRHVANLSFASFAQGLDEARTFWRKYRALVEAPEFPEFLVAPLCSEWETGPGHCAAEPMIEDITVEEVLACIETNAVIPEVLERLMPDAEETARAWAHNGVAADQSFLAEMGITG
jgi:hypothetical protein